MNKLVQLFFLLVIFDSSWQQDSTETLNETLDKLIKQTDPVEVSKNDPAHGDTINNSRIYFLHPPGNHNKTGNDILKSMTNIINDPDKLISMTDILQALGLGGPKIVDDGDHNIGKGQIIKDVTITVEKEHEISNSGSEESQENLTTKTRNPAGSQTISNNTGLKDTNSVDDRGHVGKEIAGEKYQGHESINSGSEEDRIGAPLTSRGAHPVDLTANSDNALLSYAAETKNSLLHKYPQIIIDRIIPHNNKNIPEKTIANKPVGKPQTVLEEINNYPNIAKELKSLLDELHKLKAAEALSKVENAEHALSASQRQGTYSHNGQHRCNNPLMPYSAPCESLISNKLPHLHGSLSRAGDPHLHTNLHSNIWGAGNSRHDALLRISRAHKMKRIQFLTHLINNMMSRFVYRPLYDYL